MKSKPTSPALTMSIASSAPLYQLQGPRRSGFCSLLRTHSSCSCAVHSPLWGSESTKLAPSSALRFTLHPLHLLFPQPRMFFSQHSHPHLHMTCSTQHSGLCSYFTSQRTSLLTTLYKRTCPLTLITF